MVGKEQSGPGAAVPGPDTFDFESYISGVSSFPKFKHTVYLDQENGVALLKVYDECEKIAERGKEIEAELDTRSEKSARSLVDDEIEELNEELETLRERAEELESRKLALEERVKLSALTFHFQVGTAQKLGSVVRQAEKEYHKKHGRGSDDDLEYMAGKFRYQLEAQLEAYCTGITLADGKRMDPPGRAGFSRLLDSLITSESARLMSALNENLDSSATWADRLDAGFPGGGSDVDGQPVGASGDPDGKVVESPPADPADRGGI
ncbi:hypothetical protein [Streptomyces sp. 5-10]|uniref:hypothetical protein n=1 Tax=Streptomyces sp. 5-10 TaxID=878925 RepID=UPI00168A981E|nr:hypothetical protein [Streptomyces sp. 5-10]MBD3004909.1 hypothetical protein [Streptomyces sp. 5-10]